VATNQIESQVHGGFDGVFSWQVLALGSQVVLGRSSGRLENNHAQAKGNAIRPPVAQVGGQRIDKDLVYSDGGFYISHSCVSELRIEICDAVSRPDPVRCG
jgi:hypothetical protein